MTFCSFGTNNNEIVPHPSCSGRLPSPEHCSPPPPCTAAGGQGPGASTSQPRRVTGRPSLGSVFSCRNGFTHSRHRRTLSCWKAYIRGTMGRGALARFPQSPRPISAPLTGALELPASRDRAAPHASPLRESSGRSDGRRGWPLLSQTSRRRWRRFANMAMSVGLTAPVPERAESESLTRDSQV